MTSAVLDGPSSSNLRRMQASAQPEPPQEKPLPPDSVGAFEGNLPSAKSFKDLLQKSLFNASDSERDIAKLSYPAALAHRLADQITALSYHEYRLFLAKILGYEDACGDWNKQVEALRELVEKRDQVKAGVSKAPHTEFRVPAEHNLRLLGDQIDDHVRMLDAQRIPRIRDFFGEVLTGQRFLGRFRPGDAVQAVQVVNDFSPEFKACIDTCSELLKAAKCHHRIDTVRPAPEHSGYPLLHDKSFARDLRIFLRLAFPGGINIANPSNDPGEISSFSAADKITLNWCGNEIHIRPHPERPGVCSLIARDGDMEHYIKLRDGSTLLIGRDFSQTSFFNNSVSSEGLRVMSDLHLNNPQVSRAALEIIMKDGRIYILDRGSRNPVEVIQEGNRPATLLYKPALTADGEFGHSVWQELPRPPKAEEKPR